MRRDARTKLGRVCSPIASTCLSGYIINVSKPFLVQMNYRGLFFNYGGWGRDSMAGADQNVLWVAPVNPGGRLFENLCIYKTYNDLLLYNPVVDKNLASVNYGQGGGMIMFNKTMYYNCYDSRNICKYNPQTNVMEVHVALPNASYNNQFSYSSSPYQDIDMASDEEGLWVIYSTPSYAGNIVISKLDPISLKVTQTWVTGQNKTAASNAFMACGVLYATRSLSTQKEEIFYMYYTKTKKEGSLKISMEKIKENVASLSYNPNDHKLYMYDAGFLVSYNVVFKPTQ
ncbi:olfactomedin-4-like [Dendropsophus ebraccatus]|uniref:olfactomedin-4-like n=1 Tax=Dendropsophus ebraccatus TaxID=150705 RepID=UPI0038320768